MDESPELNHDEVCGRQEDRNPTVPTRRPPWPIDQKPMVLQFKAIH